MDREKSIYCVLLLVGLIVSFQGSFARTVYQAEENKNITLEWIFPSITNKPTNSYIVYCEVFTGEWPVVLFHLHNGVEVPQAQHEDFRGRVHCDTDVLGDGLLRLTVSGLRTEDSSVYGCQVAINKDVAFSEVHVNVTRAMVRSEPKGPNPSWEWTVLYSALGLMAVSVAAAAAAVAVCYHKRTVSSVSQESLAV